LGIDFLTFSFLLENGAKTGKDFSKRIKIFFEEKIWQFKNYTNLLIFNDLFL